MIELLGSLFDPLVTLLGSGLQLFHGWGAPWWLSIVMLTVVVRSVLFPLTVRQVRNMRQMQELKPDLDEIREKYRDDPQEQQQAMTKLYTDRKVNPLGGCLPLFIQMPVFLGLFYTIKEFENLQSFTSGGILWFQDLTVADPFFVLPVVFVLTMRASQEITLRNTAPQQRQLMRFLPVVFGVFMALGGFPAGLFVYWIANNLIAVVQNALIYLPFNNAVERGQRE
ncbi:hypothetical protein BH24ACT21_BH24ACT21_06950 [soil metagenome]|jgi:YidC/Oxa1 family membrane protein insertase